MVGLEQFCFSCGEANHAEGAKGDVVYRPQAPDKVGDRRTETQRAGQIGSKSGELRLDRTPSTPSPNLLALNPICSGRMVQSSHGRLSLR